MQHRHSGQNQLQLWYCVDCSGVHLRTDHVSLTLNNDEFAQLSRAVLEMYQENVTDEKEELLNNGHAKLDDAKVDDVLDSDLIA